MDQHKEPSLIDQAKSLGAAAVNWATKDGFHKVTEEQFQERKNICNACPHWDNTAFNNMGKCKLCGCSIMKLYFPHSICPDKPSRWLPVRAKS